MVVLFFYSFSFFFFVFIICCLGVNFIIFWYFWFCVTLCIVTCIYLFILFVLCVWCMLTCILVACIFKFIICLCLFFLKWIYIIFDNFLFVVVFFNKHFSIYCLLSLNFSCILLLYIYSIMIINATVFYVLFFLYFTSYCCSMM